MSVISGRGSLLTSSTKTPARSIEGLINLLIDDFEASRPHALYSETLAHPLAMRFLLCGSSSEHARNSSVEPLPPGVPRRIRDRIETELDTELSLASLAKESGYSPAHFLRMFCPATGLTPHQYVLERRLSATQRLLRQSKMLLADIALKCGFSSQTHMNDVFRKRLGVTPLKYRRDIQHDLRNIASLWRNALRHERTDSGIMWSGHRLFLIS